MLFRQCQTLAIHRTDGVQLLSGGGETDPFFVEGDNSDYLYSLATNLMNPSKVIERPDDVDNSTWVHTRRMVNYSATSEGIVKALLNHRFVQRHLEIGKVDGDGSILSSFHPASVQTRLGFTAKRLEEIATQCVSGCNSLATPQALRSFLYTSHVQPSSTAHHRH
jgi:hypothetical protein